MIKALCNFMVKFFLDTASVDEIKIWQQSQLVSGVTTNPILLAKEKKDPIKVLQDICDLSPGPVSAQVTEKVSEKMIKQGINLAKINKKIIVKVPCNYEGLKAAKTLKKKGVKLNITLGFNPSQIVAFSNLDVDYFSLIIGKTEDWGFSNIDSIEACKQIIKKMKSKTKLLVASIRNEEHLQKAITEGADVVTVPPATWKIIYENKYSQMGLDSFFSSWNSIDAKFKKNYEK